MTTTVKHAGSEREVECSLESWEKHQDVIKHWCNGGDVEFRCKDFWYMKDGPKFNSQIDYRIKQREPLMGEVWVSNNQKPYIRTPNGRPNSGSGDAWVDFEGVPSVWYNWSEDLTYTAPSLEVYIARKLWEQRMDGVRPRAAVLSEVVQQAARLND